jgi:hypothetical protein
MKSNHEESLTLIRQLLGVTNKFSPKGLSFLACRFNGSQKATLGSLLEKMQSDSIIPMIDEPLQKEIQLAFGLDKLTDEAVIILAMGRRPVLGKYGWSEAGYSLLKDYQLPADYDTLDEKSQKKAQTFLTLQTLQRAVCEKITELFTVVPVAAPVVEEVKAEVKPKTSNVKQFPKKAATKKEKKV